MTEALLKNNLLEVTASIGTLTMTMASFEHYKNIVHWVNSGDKEALVFEGSKPGEKYAFRRVSLSEQTSKRIILMYCIKKQRLVVQCDKIEVETKFVIR